MKKWVRGSTAWRYNLHLVAALLLQRVYLAEDLALHWGDNSWLGGNKHTNLCHVSNVSVRMRLTFLPANGPVPQLKMQLNYSTFKPIAILHKLNKVPCMSYAGIGTTRCVATIFFKPYLAACWKTGQLSIGNKSCSVAQAATRLFLENDQILDRDNY